MARQITASIDQHQRADRGDEQREEQPESINIKGQIDAQAGHPGVGDAEGTASRDSLDEAGKIQRQSQGQQGQDPARRSATIDPALP